MDFGISKVLETGDEALTEAKGTPQYMPPEQILGREIDGRTDLYALGISMFEMATAQRPFSGDERRRPAAPRAAARSAPPAPGDPRGSGEDPACARARRTPTTASRPRTRWRRRSSASSPRLSRRRADAVPTVTACASRRPSRPRPRTSARARRCLRRARRARFARARTRSPPQSTFTSFTSMRPPASQPRPNALPISWRHQAGREHSLHDHVGEAELLRLLAVGVVVADRAR